MDFSGMFENLELNNSNKIYGVVTGVVKENDDPEKLGRIRVEFPWRQCCDTSGWARVLTPLAGNGFGLYFLPEVGDEVLVAFGEGDINNPYVIGSLWNSKQKPLETNSDKKNNIRKIRSRSGHEIVFNDNKENNEGKIEIHTNAGQMILLDESASTQSIEIKDKGGSSIKMDSMNKAITIKCDMQLNISAKMIEIEADTSLKLKAGAVLTIEGGIVKIN
jgi:uncharacterized protein involved in type VI secretion and phage assembly